MKKEKFEAPAVRWKKDTKLKKFIELILIHTNTANIDVPESFSGYLANNIVGDKKSMSAKITKQYPKNGTQLNKIFKPFYKTLAFDLGDIVPSFIVPASFLLFLYFCKCLIKWLEYKDKNMKKVFDKEYCV